MLVRADLMQGGKWPGKGHLVSDEALVCEMSPAKKAPRNLVKEGGVSWSSGPAHLLSHVQPFPWERGYRL